MDEKQTETKPQPTFGEQHRAVIGSGLAGIDVVCTCGETVFRTGEAIEDGSKSVELTEVNKAFAQHKVAEATETIRGALSEGWEAARNFVGQMAGERAEDGSWGTAPGGPKPE